MRDLPLFKSAHRRKKSIKDVRLKVDLTKKRHTLLVKANECVKNIPKVKLCYADINCRLKVKWEVSGTSDSFFRSLDQLKSIIEDDEKIYAVSDMRISTKIHVSVLLLASKFLCLQINFIIGIRILVIKLQLPSYKF